MDEIFDVVVVGGGAAGFFAAIQLAECNSALRILIVEKSNKVLSKVKVSGGGRCNVTHHCFNPFKLARHYPRGEKALKELFKKFQARDMVSWLAANGVETKAEADGRMFPESDNSQTIIDCFVGKANSLGVKIRLGWAVERVDARGTFQICCTNGVVHAKHLLIACGGNANPQFYKWISDLGHSIKPPVPSLFTFNDPVRMFSDLMGVSCADAEVRIQRTSFKEKGPVLITHWGFSGPAIIKLSAWAAEHLHDLRYKFGIHINWTGVEDEKAVVGALRDNKTRHPRQRVRSVALFNIPTRLWDKLCALAEVEETRVWGELPAKNFNKMVENLYRCDCKIIGKTTFKEEFVTCGGVDLKELNLSTMESRITPNLYFAGEVLNIDGETGGFNFQAAWSTAYVAARSIAEKPIEPLS